MNLLALVRRHHREIHAKVNDTGVEYGEGTAEYAGRCGCDRTEGREWEEYHRAGGGQAALGRGI